MSVQAVWKKEEELGNTAENILYWEPTGELSVPVEKAGNRAWDQRNE